MRPIRITRALTAADADGIAQAQQLGAAGDLTLDGDLVAGGVAQLNAQRKVGIASTGNLSAITFTVYGTDQAGRTISEALAGPNNNTVSTTLDFYTVTRVAASAAVATDVEVGTTEVGASMPIPLDQYLTPFNVSLVCDVTGTVNYTVQFTGDDVFAGTGVGPFTWFDHPDITGSTADDTGTYISPVTATRIVTNSGTGSVAFTILQAGAGS
jgi:hypothetical protein